MVAKLLIDTLGTHYMLQRTMSNENEKDGTATFYSRFNLEKYFWWSSSSAKMCAMQQRLAQILL